MWPHKRSPTFHLEVRNGIGTLDASETERKPEDPASTRDEALFNCTIPSGVPRGPYQLHSIPEFSEARDPLLPSRPLDSLSKRSNSGEQLDHAPSRHPSREGLGPPPQLLRVREAPASGPSHGPSTEQLDILSSILASFTSSALSSSVQSSGTPSGPHTTPTPSATASALGPSTPRSATSHSISELSPDSE